MDNLIDAHIAHCRHLGLSEVTITERARVLHQAERDLPHGLDEAHQRDLQAWLGRGLKPATRRSYRAHLVGFYGWATDPADPWLSHDPTSRLPKVRVPRGLPHPAALDELRTALTRLGEPWRLAVLLAAYAGLRCCEIVALRREDITADTLTIRCGKGGESDVLPTHPVIWAAVESLPDGFVVPLSPGRLEPRRKLSRYLWWHLRRVGVPRSAHDFRHTYGTELYARTQDLRRTQELMRHRSPTTTMIYTLIGDEERRIAVAALPAVT